MSCELEPAKSEAVLYRIGRRPDPWTWPDWAYAGPDGTFGNRYDDPLGEYRVLYASSQRLGIARCDATFADIGHARSLAYLREALAPVVLRHGLDELDATAIRLQAPRRLTQEISRHVYECRTAGAERALQGIRYLSRLGDDIENWAIFEPATLELMEIHEIPPHDSDLREAVALLGLMIGTD